MSMEKGPSDLNTPELPDPLDPLEAAIRRLPRAADVDVEAALARVKGRRFEERTGNVWRTNWTRIAAAIVIVLAGSLVWRSAVIRKAQTPAVASLQNYVTEVGQTRSIKLPDGTALTLGPDSRVELAAGYATGARTVKLIGNALFDVTHDASRPFTVQANKATIRDIGTTFAVRSNPGEAVHVAVTAGTVVLNVAGKQEAEGIVLHAGDHGIANENGQVFAETGDIKDGDLAWTHGELIFDDAPLDRVASDLRHWYGIELQIVDAELKNRHVTASFKDEQVDQVLKVIALALGASIERNGNIATLHLK